MLRGGDVLARAADAEDHGQRAAPADRQPRGRQARPGASGGAGRGERPPFRERPLATSTYSAMKTHYSAIY